MRMAVTVTEGAKPARLSISIMMIAICLKPHMFRLLVMPKDRGADSTDCLGLITRADRAKREVIKQSVLSCF